METLFTLAVSLDGGKRSADFVERPRYRFDLYNDIMYPPDMPSHETVESEKVTIDRQYINVDGNGTASFAIDNTLNLSMSQCTPEAYLESYSSLVNFSSFELVSLRTMDTEPCVGLFEYDGHELQQIPATSEVVMSSSGQMRLPSSQDIIILGKPYRFAFGYGRPSHWVEGSCRTHSRMDKVGWGTYTDAVQRRA